MKKLVKKVSVLVLSLIVLFSSFPNVVEASVTKVDNLVQINSAVIVLPEVTWRIGYNQAKKTDGKATLHSDQTGGSLDTTGTPYSTKDLYDKEGNLKQRRYYGKNGNAERDIDYKHGGNGKEPFPHKHDWKDGVRGPAYW